MKAVAALVAGVLFGVGLVLSGMTDPHRVRAFLDVTGGWDPTLAFVMAGAIAVYAPVAWWVLRRGRAAWAPLHLPPFHRVDARLVAGAALFGVGWGLSGFCPGPALLSLVALGAGTVVFVVFMALGAWLAGSPKVVASATEPGVR